MTFDDPDMLRWLESAGEADLDALDFGVIGIGPDGAVSHYNTWEVEAAGISRDWAAGRDFFNEVGLCMNNFLVAQRFGDEPALDAFVDYVLTFRMKPTRVTLRLLQHPDSPTRWVLIRRV
ncbi:hypothetical protein [Caenispirillum salinarum]|uniref:hypothetical protein n=1 Tax=Caenispirillum salinarum TaxID=859058 RepID=UPI00384C60FF